jgi:antitoxin PrlF
MKIPIERENPSCCTPACRVEAILTVDERGQMVLPKDIRDRAGIQPGGKLALISWERDGEVCCISLINTGRLMGLVQEALAPMMKDMTDVTR